MNTERFKSIILQHQPAMQRMAECLLHNETEAEDAVQDAVVQLWNQREELLGSASAEAFCITVVKRRCVDLLRKRHIFVPIDEAPLQCDPPPDDEDRYQKALALVRRLPPQQQQAILMKYEEQLSSEEIAERLGVSLTNLYTILSRAYSALRESLKDKS